MTTITYAYLAENIPFTQLSKKDFTRLGNSFKKLEENADGYPFFHLAMTSEGYDEIYGKEYTSKDAFFTALDKACYLENTTSASKIGTRKTIIGIYQNIEHLLTPDEEYGTSYTIYVYDPLWDGLQDDDYICIHKQNNRWFVNKTEAEDIGFDKNESDSEFWDYVSHSRADPELDLKRYYLERDNI